MNRLLFSLLFSFSALACYAQRDTTVRQNPQQLPTTISPVVTPSNGVPMTAPAAEPVSTPGTVINPRESRGKRKVRVVPPSEPNAFGVGATLEKRDTTRRKDN
ncbi:hypothetical protein LX87_00144 [Larkinella arboricola]|uniref:Uncharacterized protein n=1 Tax=Larkinella arboricola TaxID=643671 RepID=A0A327X4D5_LARAB|nr:hypothetical protein [Larkinella arboricola]RAK02030.1 hypothetical protein LX87_00144 [Larkinella arboricola]